MNSLASVWGFHESDSTKPLITVMNVFLTGEHGGVWQLVVRMSAYLELKTLTVLHDVSPC